jgi:hypothetical protein
VTPKRRRRRAVELPPAQHAKNKAYGRRYRLNRAKVLGQSRACSLRLPGCTHWATETDHVVEARLGGPSVVENLQPSCRNCNQAKARGVTWSGDGVPPASEFQGGCASDEGGPHDLSEWGGPSECYGAAGHASRDWS